jgi:hypothetical protein
MNAHNLKLSRPGGSTLLIVDLDDGQSVEIPLGPAECVALACELLADARVRYGRNAWPISVSETGDPTKPEK